MSDVIYNEEIPSEIAGPLIGAENVLSNAKYYMVTEEYSTTIVRVSESGEETTFELEETQQPTYSDGIDFAKIETPFEEEVNKRSNPVGVLLLILMALGIVGGIACIAYLITFI